MLSLVFLGFLSTLFRVASAVITHGVTYDRMPALTSVDAYAPCLRARGDSYCYVSAALHGNDSHPLYSALMEHSANKFTHFNRTNLHRGICLKTTCRKYLNVSQNVTIVLETCLNATLQRDYGLGATVFKVQCSEYREKVQWDVSDFAFGAVMFALLMLNVIGSLYDFFGSGGNDTIVTRILLCFSMRRNWQRLVAPLTNDPGQMRLAGLTLHRIIFSIGILFGHTSLSSFRFIENPEYIEEAYNNLGYMILLRAMEVAQVGAIMSAILLAYNVLTSEKYGTWRNLHKALLLRWLRFTPLYALALFFLSTWARHVGEGPTWRATVEAEANDCRRNWWLHLLYVNNYVDNSRCMLHSWSMAVDMQLTAVGLGIFLLLKNNRARQTAIALLLLVGMITPPIAIYFKNLHPIIIGSPELIRNGFVNDETFNYLYKRGHTNIVCYALGLALGYVIYNLKESELRAGKYKMFVLLHWLLVPAVFILQLTGSSFYDPGASVPLPVRLFYSSAMKLASGLILGLHIYLTVVNVGSLRTRLFSWPGWTPVARLTFSVYIIHWNLLRIRYGVFDNLIQVSAYVILQNFAETAAACFLLALPLFLLVESPFAQLTRQLFAAGRHEKKRAD